MTPTPPPVFSIDLLLCVTSDRVRLVSMSEIIPVLNGRRLSMKCNSKYIYTICIIYTRYSLISISELAHTTFRKCRDLLNYYIPQRESNISKEVHFKSLYINTHVRIKKRKAPIVHFGHTSCPTHKTNRLA